MRFYECRSQSGILVRVVWSDWFTHTSLMNGTNDRAAVVVVVVQAGTRSLIPNQKVTHK